MGDVVVAVFFILLCVLGAIAWFAGGLDDSALRYEIQYDEVTIADKPNDCDFWTAPLGKKNCKYEKEVSLVLFSIGVSGNPIISYDEGENWHRNKGGPTYGERAHISWVRYND